MNELGEDEDKLENRATCITQPWDSYIVLLLGNTQHKIPTKVTVNLKVTTCAIVTIHFAYIIINEKRKLTILAFLFAKPITINKIKMYQYS